jgi:hypothetical protein
VVSLYQRYIVEYYRHLKQLSLDVTNLFAALLLAADVRKVLSA